MTQRSKQAAIYLSLLFCCTPYTMIATFLPSIAQSNNVPLWLVGLIFSADPIAGLFTSMILGKVMFQIGRKTTILIGLALSGFSMFVLCPLEFIDQTTMISLSLLSRVLAGCSAGFIMTAADSIVVSDYPDRIDEMVGKLEGAIGIGLIIGPLIGMVLYFSSLFWSLVALGGVIMCFVPVCSKMLGEFREYVIENNEMSSFKLMMKPKITLDLGMNVVLLFTFGFVIPSLELHLIDFGLSEVLISLCFILHTGSYAGFSIFGSALFERLDYRTTLVTGLAFIGLAFLMIGPWELIFPKNVWIVVFGLPVLGMGQAMIYIPTYPHMIQSANEDYGFEKDDILSDAISGLSNMSCDIGEIIGPIITGLLLDLIGFELTSMTVAFSCILYAAVYLFGSGLMFKWTSRRSKDSLIRKIVPDDRKINSSLSSV